MSSCINLVWDYVWENRCYNHTVYMRSKKMSLSTKHETILLQSLHLWNRALQEPTVVPRSGYLPEPSPSDQVYGRLSTRGVSAREKPWHQLTSLAALAGNSPDASRWFHRPDESVLLETSVQYKPQDCWSLTTVSESHQLRKGCN